jgi:hypothetical protein
MTLGYREFEFDLPGALLANLVYILADMDGAPLTAEALANVPEAQGVYQLFHGGGLVYIGKTDSEAGLHKRLTRHARKVLFRKNITPEQVTFKAIRIFVFTAMDLETELIGHYGGVRNIPWNGSGFGSNDPGRERDTTRVKPTNFDALYPIDIDREVGFAPEQGSTVADTLAALKDALPFTLRYQGKDGKPRSPHPDLAATTTPPCKPPFTVRRIIGAMVSALPPGWQATALPGYVILYKECRADYPLAEVIARS